MWGKTESKTWPRKLFSLPRPSDFELTEFEPNDLKMTKEYYCPLEPVAEAGTVLLLAGAVPVDEVFFKASRFSIALRS